MAEQPPAMVFVSVHELLPMGRRYRQTSLFALGALLTTLIPE